MVYLSTTVFLLCVHSKRGFTVTLLLVAVKTTAERRKADQGHVTARWARAPPTDAAATEFSSGDIEDSPNPPTAWYFGALQQLGCRAWYFSEQHEWLVTIDQHELRCCSCKSSRTIVCTVSSWVCHGSLWGSSWILQQFHQWRQAQGTVHQLQRRNRQP